MGFTINRIFNVYLQLMIWFYRMTLKLCMQNNDSCVAQKNTELHAAHENTDSQAAHEFLTRVLTSLQCTKYVLTESLDKN